MIKPRVFPILVTIVLSGFVSQAQTVKRLDPQSFEQKLKTSSEPMLIDVRTPSEYAQGHLPKAKLIDIYSDDFESRINKLDKSKPVFVYCKAGSRSSSAVNILAESGFKEIYDLSGGIIAWTKAGKTVEK